MYATVPVQRYCVSPSQINMGDRPKRMSCTTRKQLKIHFVGFSHEYDEWRDYDNERNYFPFARFEKMFFPAEGPLEDIEATFFAGDCIVASRESCGPAEKMTPRCA